MRLWIKQSLLISVFIFSTATLLGWLFLRYEVDIIENALREKGKSLADSFSRSSEFGIAFRHTDQLEKLASGLTKERDVVYALVLDDEGKLLSGAYNDVLSVDGRNEIESFDRSVPTLTITRFTLGQTEEEILDIAAPVHMQKFAQRKAELDPLAGGEDAVLREDQQIGQIAIGFSLTLMHEAIAAATRRVILLTALITALAIALSIALSALITRPIGDLVRGTQVVSTGNFDYVIPAASNDEIGELAESFNDMTANLKETTVSRDYVDNILRSMNESLIVVSHQEQMIQTVNPATCSLLGYAQQELVGQSLERIIPNVGQIDVPGYAEASETGVGPTESVYLSKASEEIPVLLSTAALRGRDGEILGIVCLAQDIRERKFLEEQLLGAQKMEAIGQLTAGVAHNFNNMLQGISGCLEVALLDGDAKTETPLKRAQEASMRAAEMIQQLLLFSRREIVSTAEPIEIPPLLSETAEMCRRTFDRRIEIDLVPLSREVPKVLGDGAKLEQVFLNLLINARDAVAGNPGRASIDIAVDSLDISRDASPPGIASGCFVRVSIADNGVGMDSETKPRVFEPFFTTKEVGRGTGLGLTTAFAIVQQLGGWIEFDSEPQAGTNFRVLLPQVEADTKDVSSAAPSPPRSGLATGTVLVVEDEDVVREITVEILERSGHEVLAAADGVEGLRLFETEGGRIDVVLLDLSMPHMSGTEVIERLQSSPKPPQIVVFTGYGFDQDLAEQVYDVVQKPLRKDDLLRKVGNALSAT